MTRSMVITASGVALGLVSVVFSLPRFAIGVWQQSEPVVISVHVGAALCWLGLAASRRGSDLVTSPMVFPLLAMAAWGLASAILSPHPLGAILGAPQSGEGVLWSFDAAGYVLAAGMIRRDSPGTYRQLAHLGAGIVLVVGLCNFPPLRGATVIGKLPSFFSFPKFLGFSALGLFPAAWRLRRDGQGGWVILLLVALAGLLLSENRTALSGVLMLPALVRPFHPVMGSERRLTALGALGVVSAALLPYLLLRHTDWFNGSFSLWSRSILLAVTDRHIFDTAVTVLFGHGWGNYQEYLARNIAGTGISLVDGSWKDLTRDEFHSHNAAIEAAFAVGLPGVLLLLLSRIGIIRGAAPVALPMAIPFALSLSLTEATWFMLPVSLAFLGLGFAALLPERGEAVPVSATRIRSVRATAAILAAAGLILSAMQFGHARATRQLITCAKADGCPAATPPRDPIGGEAETAALIATNAGGRTGTYHNGSLAGLVRQSAARPDRPPSALLSLTLCGIFGRAAFMPETSRFGPLTQVDENLWKNEVVRLIEVAPGRMDIAAVYLNWLIRQGREGGDGDILPVLRRQAPAHPVTVWFEGLRMIADQDGTVRQAGLLALRRALDGGVKRFVDIPADIETSVQRATDG